MKHCLTFTRIEFHRFIHWKNLAVWLFTTTLLLLYANSTIDKFQALPERNQAFKQMQEEYFKNTRSYNLYSVFGVTFIFVPSPTCILTDNTVVNHDLTANVDSLVKVHIYSSGKGKSLEPGNWFGKPDIAWIVSWLVTLLAAWYGFRSYHTSAYMRCLAGLRPGFKLYIDILLPRLLLFLSAATCSLATVYGYARIRGLMFTPEENLDLLAAYASALVMLAAFFIVGAIIAGFGQRPLAYFALIASWVILAFGLSWVIDANAEPAFPDTTRDYKTQLTKYGKLMDFEKRMEKESGKFNRNKMDIARQVAEEYKTVEFPKINAVETLLKEEIREAVRAYNNRCMWFPSGLFKITIHEVSSRGYLNYLAFYDYVQDMYRLFVWFYIDRVFYHDPKELVNFLKGDESLFHARSRLPENFYSYFAFNLGVVLGMFFLGYIPFKRMIYSRAAKPAAFANVRLDLSTPGITTITSGYKEFNRQIYNAFARQARHLPWQVSLGNESLAMGKRYDFLYLPNPAAFPPELKARHVLGLFQGLMGISPEDNAHITDSLGKRFLAKRLGKMHPGEKAKLLITLSVHCFKPLVIFDDFSRGLYEDELKETREILGELKPGTTVIDLVAPGRGWLLDYNEKYDIGFRDGVYDVFPRQSADKPKEDDDE